MASSQLETARGLIVAKRYGEARAILKTMPDDPTAQKWLAKLDEISPEPSQSAQPPSDAISRPPANAKLEAARELIVEKRYAEARTLLKLIPDDPTAQEWLRRLAEIAPEPTQPAPRTPHRWWMWAVGAVVVLVAVAIGVAIVVQGSATYNESYNRTRAYLELQSYCYAHVYSVGDDRCGAWVSAVMDSGTDYGAIETCSDRHRLNPTAFTSCLVQNGFYLPGK